MISYPPIETTKGIPQVAQNRQFQYFNNPLYIYPVIPAQAATMLNQRGYDVIWNDAVAMQWSYSQFLENIKKEKPDFVAIESKTPTIKHYWKAVQDIKKVHPQCVAVLYGDHVTALPEESMINSPVDYVVTGGDYDFAIVNLCEHISKGIALEPGVWFREKGMIQNNGKYQTNHNLKEVPMIDRDLTMWWLYKYNGNYKYIPGTYTMVGRDCWWRKDGGCTFCSWTATYPNFRTKSPEELLDEVGHIVDMGIKEIFDDTGTFPVGPWLKKFCEGMIERGYSKKIKIGCNMRFGALSEEEYMLMGKAGFRFILYGFESANQKTLDMLNKGVKVEQQVRDLEIAKKAGLDPHITVMMGYPWETFEDAQRTIDLGKYLFRQGWVDTLQATIVIPYPGTSLFKQCEENGWLKTMDWERYDMREAIMKSPLTEEQTKMLTQQLYKLFFEPKYIIRKVTQIRKWDDLKFIGRGVKAVFGHLMDFSVKQPIEAESLSS